MDIETLTKELNACSEDVEWLQQFATAQQAWEACERGDWMLLWIGRHAGKPWSKKRKKLVLASCKCARLAWKWMPQESKDCIILFEKWANGENISQDNLIKALVITSASAAYAAYTAYTAYAAYTAYTAAASASAAYAASTSAAYAASTSAAASASAAYADARKKTLKKAADIVREFYPNIDEVIKK